MMPRKQQDKPLNRISMVSSRLRMVATHVDPESVMKLMDIDPIELLCEANYALEQLMEFRNVVNSMVRFDEEVEESLTPYYVAKGEE